MSALSIALLPRRLRLRRKILKAAGVGLALTVVYFGFLAFQNHEAKLYFEQLRQTDPVRYLEDVRKSEGFESYLDKLRLLEGFDRFQPAAPPFLVGRWTLKTAPERVAPGYVFPDCTNPVRFETGLVTVGSGADAKSYDAQYRIAGHDIWLRVPQVGLVKVGLVAYAAGIDHLEIVVPGQTAKSYAYLCGN